LHGALAEQFNATGDPAVIDELLRRVTIGEGSGVRSTDEIAVNADARRVLRSHFDAVAAEIITSLSYTSHQYPDAAVSRLVLCGGGASLSGLAQYLGALLKVTTVTARAGDLVRVTDSTSAADPALALAIGMALHDGTANG
jgi:Tfp pilus assembly PilM family ATPase